jgi:uncharacterized protein (TIGR00303 family)
MTIKEMLNTQVKTIVGKESNINFIKDLVGKKPFFLLTISNTKVAEIPGITVAGANRQLIKYTPISDAELLEFGRCKSIVGVPATPDGKPTPALITATALRLRKIPHLIVNAGVELKPQTPFIDVGAEGPTENIMIDRASSRSVVERVFENARLLGETIARIADYLILGESIPGGTTTALAMLCALGIDARDKVSSSMPVNPHHLKSQVVNNAMKRHNLRIGDLAADPLEAASLLGDLMMVAVAGIALGSQKHKTPVVLAGGTQMVAVLAIIQKLLNDLPKMIAVCTTRYVLEDKTADLTSLASSVSPHVPLFATDPGLGQSSKQGLRAYAEGFVKEGVGAGGSILGALLHSSFTITTGALLQQIERNYEKVVERQVGIDT